MKYAIALVIILGLSTPSFAIFGNRGCHSCVPHHNNVVVVQRPTVVTQTQIIIPTRIETYAEVKGLRTVEDLAGNKFVEVNGRIINVVGNVTEVTKEILDRNKIVIEQTITQNF